MKRKDLILLIITVVILLVAGYIVYSQLLPKQATSAKNAGVQVEVIGPIDAGLNHTGLTDLTTPTTATDYSVQLNTTGGNTSIFGQ